MIKLLVLFPWAFQRLFNIFLSVFITLDVTSRISTYFVSTIFVFLIFGLPSSHRESRAFVLDRKSRLHWHDTQTTFHFRSSQRKLVTKYHMNVEKIVIVVWYLILFVFYCVARWAAFGRTIQLHISQPHFETGRCPQQQETENLGTKPDLCLKCWFWETGLLENPASWPDSSTISLKIILFILLELSSWTKSSLLVTKPTPYRYPPTIH